MSILKQMYSTVLIACFTTCEDQTLRKPLIASNKLLTQALTLRSYFKSSRMLTLALNDQIVSNPKFVNYNNQAA